MIRTNTRRSRFRPRRTPRGANGVTLALAGRRVSEELSRGCRGRLALCVPSILLPSGDGAVEGRAPSKPAASLARRILGLLASVVIGLHLFWIGTTSLVLFTYKFVQPSATVLMAWRSLSFGWKLSPPRPVPLRTVPVWLRSMLISVEDYKFYQHHGFDLEAIKRAYEIDKRLAQPLYGGSTLSMQVARTLFLVPLKSYLRKYLEVIATVELEAILGKDRILELYFGYAEWGKGLFGIEAAARKYYGKGVRALTRDEGARLIAILSSPIKYRPDWFGKSLILEERYEFLSKRYAPLPAPVTSEAAASQPTIGAGESPIQPPQGGAAVAPSEAPAGAAPGAAPGAGANGVVPAAQAGVPAAQNGVPAAVPAPSAAP